jgi:hypothetical protein
MHDTDAVSSVPVSITHYLLFRLPEASRRNIWSMLSLFKKQQRITDTIGFYITRDMLRDKQKRADILSMFQWAAEAEVVIGLIAPFMMLDSRTQRDIIINHLTKLAEAIDKGENNCQEISQYILPTVDAHGLAASEFNSIVESIGNMFQLVVSQGYTKNCMSYNITFSSFDYLKPALQTLLNKDTYQKQFELNKQNTTVFYNSHTESKKLIGDFNTSEKYHWNLLLYTNIHDLVESFIKTYQDKNEQLAANKKELVKLLFEAELIFVLNDKVNIFYACLAKHILSSEKKPFTLVIIKEAVNEFVQRVKEKEEASTLTIPPLPKRVSLSGIGMSKVSKDLTPTASPTVIPRRESQPDAIKSSTFGTNDTLRLFGKNSAQSPRSSTDTGAIKASTSSPRSMKPIFSVDVSAAMKERLEKLKVDRSEDSLSPPSPPQSFKGL